MIKKLIRKTIYIISCIGIFTNGVIAVPDDYTEDLSVHRKVFSPLVVDYKPCHYFQSKPKKKKDFTTVYDITQQLEQLLLDIKAYNEMTLLIEGYTIQSYNGSNRKMALEIKEQLSNTFYPFKAEVQYKQPNFTVEIGVFLSILEAYPLYFRIKKSFPQSIIRPTSFPNKANLFEFETAAGESNPEEVEEAKEEEEREEERASAASDEPIGLE